MNKRIAFGWYGGKFSHLNWLLPLLPECTHYCEPFGGSAAVLLNRAPSKLETFNDIDGELVHFFRMLRDRPQELIQAIGLTPFSRAELAKACQGEGADELERARQFFVRARQVRTGLAQTASPGRWAHCKLSSRAGMAAAVSRWLGSVEGLAEIAQRLLRVQIECAPALEVIKRYDNKETGEQNNNKISVRMIGKIIRDSLQVRPKKRGGVYVIPVEEYPKLRWLFEKYGIGEIVQQ